MPGPEGFFTTIPGPRGHFHYHSRPRGQKRPKKGRFSGTLVLGSIFKESQKAKKGGRKVGFWWPGVIIDRLWWPFRSVMMIIIDRYGWYHRFHWSLMMMIIIDDQWRWLLMIMMMIDDDDHNSMICSMNFHPFWYKIYNFYVFGMIFHPLVLRWWIYDWLRSMMVYWHEFGSFGKIIYRSSMYDTKTHAFSLIMIDDWFDSIVPSFLFFIVFPIQL